MPPTIDPASVPDVHPSMAPIDWRTRALAFEDECDALRAELAALRAEGVTA